MAATVKPKCVSCESRNARFPRGTPLFCGAKCRNQWIVARATDVEMCPHCGKQFIGDESTFWRDDHAKECPENPEVKSPAVAANAGDDNA